MTNASTLDRIRQRREALKASKTLDLVVPGYQGDVAVRYRLVEDDAFEKLAQDATDGKNIEANLDLLIRACESVLARNPETGSLEAIEDEEGPIVGFDLRLAQDLGFEAETAREVVRGLFSPEGAQPMAFFQHAGALTQWLSGNERGVDRALLGE